MLLNCKPEELIKYSKGTYDKEKFIQSVKESWELTEKQCYMTYLVADLAIKAEGVFSISHDNFLEMFKRRFKVEISLSSVRRFFVLLHKLEVLTINHAKRKNNKQSANIYIIEPIDSLVEQVAEQPYEHLNEHISEQLNEQHNVVINKDFNKDLKISLKNNLEEEKGTQKYSRLKFKADFSSLEIRQAYRFIAPQMYDTFNDLDLSESFKERVICYMAMAGIKYISTKEFRTKNLEIEKEGKEIIDRAFYIIKGITMKRTSSNSDSVSYVLDKAEKKQQLKKKEIEQDFISIPFYDWLNA